MTNLQKAQNFGILIAERWFKDLTKELQDSDFKSKFPKVVHLIAEDVCPIIFSLTELKNMRELEEEAGKAAYNRALELIKTI